MELLQFRRQAQMIFQDPYQSLNPRFTVFDIVCRAADHSQPRARADDARRVIETLGTGRASSGRVLSSTAFRMNSVAGSASVLRSRGRSCCDRGSSSPTSRSRCSTFPCAPASCGSSLVQSRFRSVGHIHLARHLDCPVSVRPHRGDVSRAHRRDRRHVIRAR